MKFRSFRATGLVLGLVFCGCGKTTTTEAGDVPADADGTSTSDATLEAGSTSDAPADVGAAMNADAAMDADAVSTLDAGRACGAFSFAPAVPYDIPAKFDLQVGGVVLPRGLAAGDLDGDGKPDLVVSNDDGTANVLLNKGDGSFGKASSIPTRSGGTARAIDVITFDANGDKELDLAFVNFPYNVTVSGITVSLNKGGAVFDAPVDYIFPNVVTFTSVVAGDLTGDGKADLAVSMAFGAVGVVGVLVNKGDGTFQDAVTYPVAGPAWSLAIADVDGVKHGDLVVATANSSVGVLLNKGDGTFGAEKEYPSPGRYCYVNAADLSGDDKPDIALSCGYIVVLLNMGNDTFGSAAAIGSSPVGRFVAVDLLGRGRRDVVAPGPPLLISPNQGNGTFGMEQMFEYPRTTTKGTAVVSADFNSDDRPDLAVATNSMNGLAVFLNTCTP